MTLKQLNLVVQFNQKSFNRNILEIFILINYWKHWSPLCNIIAFIFYRQYLTYICIKNFTDLKTLPLSVVNNKYFWDTLLETVPYCSDKIFIFKFFSFIVSSYFHFHSNCYAISQVPDTIRYKAFFSKLEK